MKLSVKTLLIILATLGAVFAVVHFSKNSGHSSALRPVLVDIDTARVSKVIIATPTDSAITTLQKVKSAWEVRQGDSVYYCVESKVKRLLASLEDIKPGGVASGKKDKWGEYQVADTLGLHLSVYEGRKKTLDIILGKFAPMGQRSYQTYVRLAGDTYTYIAPNFMKLSISTTPSQYRDDRLTRLTKDSLSSIVIGYPESNITLERAEEGWYAGDVLLDSLTVDSWLSDVTYLSSTKFASEDPRSGSPERNIVFASTNKQDTQLSAYASEGDYLVTSSDNENEAFRDDRIFEKIFIPVDSLLVQPTVETPEPQPSIDAAAG